MCSIIGSLLPALFLVLTSYVTCEIRHVAVVFLTLGIGCTGIQVRNILRIMLSIQRIGVVYRIDYSVHSIITRASHSYVLLIGYCDEGLDYLNGNTLVPYQCNISIKSPDTSLPNHIAEIFNDFNQRKCEFKSFFSLLFFDPRFFASYLINTLQPC